MRRRGHQPPPFHPTRLTSLGDARQVVVVISGSWSSSRAEDLSSYGRQYRHAAVIAYNLPTATADVDTRRGGGIFLHVDRPGATTGCVSVAQADLERVLRWLDPTQAPVIVMGPRSAVTRM